MEYNQTVIFSVMNVVVIPMGIADLAEDESRDVVQKGLTLYKEEVGTVGPCEMLHDKRNK